MTNDNRRRIYELCYEFDKLYRSAERVSVADFFALHKEEFAGLQEVLEAFMQLLCDTELAIHKEWVPIKRLIQQSGKYQFLGEIGSGGMGAVYLAHDVWMNINVAIKILAENSDHYNDNPEDAVKRFTREIEIHSRLTAQPCEQIVQALTVEMCGEKRMLVMQFVDGKTLEQILKDKRTIEPKEAINYIFQVAKGLSHAYTMKIVHRDIHTGNIMIDKKNRVKILDIGLGVLESSESTDTPRITQVKISPGRNGFKSPEQSAGYSNLDIRTDIYGLGATFYHIVTGKDPATQAPGVPLSFRNSGITVKPAFEKILKKMCAQNREARYQTPQALMNDILLKVDPFLDWRGVAATLILSSIVSIVLYILFLVFFFPNLGKREMLTPNDALLIAARQGTVQDVVQALNKGADIREPLCTNNNWTALHFAAAHNSNIDVTKYLISQRADVFAPDKDGWIPLHYFAAAHNPNVDVLKYLISQNADVFAPDKPDKNGRTPLHYAASNNPNVDVAKYLISQRADVFARDEEGKTPLDRAFESENVEVFEYLVSEGTDVKRQDNNGQTLLHYAAAYCSKREILEHLVSKGADVNADDNHGWTPLHVAAETNPNEKVIEYLVSKGADVNATSIFGTTPLHLACEYNQNDAVIKYLVSKGAKVNRGDSEDQTPLHIAARCNRSVEIIKTLVSHGAAIDERDDYCQTPLLLAAHYSFSEDVIKYLVSEGADVNARESRGRTPLHVAAMRGQPGEEVLRAILFSKDVVDVNAQDRRGNTPLDVSATKEIREIIRTAGGRRGLEVSILPLQLPAKSTSVRLPESHEDGE